MIREFGGSINFSTHGQQLEIILAKEVGVSDADRGFASLNYHSAGHRKWRNEIQFVRDRLVKTGQLSNAVRGRWTVTEDRLSACWDGEASRRSLAAKLNKYGTTLREAARA